MVKVVFIGLPTVFNQTTMRSPEGIVPAQDDAASQLGEAQDGQQALSHVRLPLMAYL